MRRYDAAAMRPADLRKEIKRCGESELEIVNCCGERYLGCGMRHTSLHITGTPGNALGAFLDGGTIIVDGNAQDATGDTMNSGVIAINGSAGDAAGYAMRGGKLYIHGNAGYRAGVNMKAYGGVSPTLIIGGRSGSFLGEYLAGGTIIVLGIGCPEHSQLTGFFCGNGMYNGRIYLRTTEIPTGFSPHLLQRRISREEKESDLRPVLTEFAAIFGENVDELLSGDFILIEPDPENRYKEMYAAI